MTGLAAARPAAQGASIVTNGGFESGVYASHGSPTGWSRDAWILANASMVWQASGGRSGGRYVSIAMPSPNDARWIQTVAVAPSTTYRLSGWIKPQNVGHSTEAVDAGAHLNIFLTDVRTAPLFGTADWTFVSVDFNTGSSTQVTVAARIGAFSGTTTGTADFDDVALQVLESNPSSLDNPGFEQGSSLPTSWTTQTVQGSGSFLWDASVRRTGSRAVKISLPSQGIARWGQDVTVDQDSEYEVTGWVRTSDVQDPVGQWWVTGARVGVNGRNGSWLGASSTGARGTTDWTYVSGRFITGGTTAARIFCTLGDADPLYARATSAGTAWCDDLALQKIRTLARFSTAGQEVTVSGYTEHWPGVNVAAYVEQLDRIYAAMADLVGAVPYGGDRIIVREDASINYAALSGNPITFGPGPGWPNVVRTHGIDFGAPHEIGHDFDGAVQGGAYITSGQFANGEHWANFKLLYGYDVLGEQEPSLTMDADGSTIPISQAGQHFITRHAQPWINAGRTDYQSMHNDVYTGLNYVLKTQIGWAPFKCAFRTYTHGTSLPSLSTDIARVQRWSDVLSQCAGVDLSPRFRSWGFPVNQTLVTHALTVNTTGSGTVTSTPAGITCGTDCTESFVNGTQVSLTATPANGWQFSGWSGACSGAGECTVTMTQARLVVATFAPPQPTISASPSASQSGAAILVSWTNLATSGNDWISMHPVGAPDSQFVSWQPVSGAAGSATFIAPSAAGSYDFRLFRNGPKVATSQGILVRSFVCAPRPRVQVQVVPNGDSRLRVTITAGAGGLSAISFGTPQRSMSNASVTWPGWLHDQVSNTRVQLAAMTSQETFYVGRAGSGGAVTVPMVVTDGCGEWETLVGSGGDGL